MQYGRQREEDCEFKESLNYRNENLSQKRMKSTKCDLYKKETAFIKQPDTIKPFILIDSIPSDSTGAC